MSLSPSNQARQELMKYFNTSILEKEKDSERTFLLFSDFFDYPKIDVTPFTGETSRDYFNYENVIFKMTNGYLILDWDHGSCGGCPTQSIRMLIYGKKKGGDGNKDENVCAKEVIEEMCDEMIYLESDNDVLNYNKSKRDEGESESDTPYPYPYP